MRDADNLVAETKREGDLSGAVLRHSAVLHGDARGARPGNGGHRHQVALLLRPAGGGGRQAAMRQMPTFADFDLNKDGKITEAEQLKARETRTEQRRAEGRQLRNQANAARFAAADTNRDGSVSPEEFAAHQATRQQARPANNRK